MRAFFVCLMLTALGSAIKVQPDDERVKNQFQSKNYKVTWSTAPVYETDAELEIGDGYGHGSKLNWFRFLPGKNGIDVLWIQFDEGRDRYESKWPPDRAKVTIKRAVLKADAYAALLRDLAIVDSANLKPVDQNDGGVSSSNFWVYVRLATTKKKVLDLNWAGYEGSSAELQYAKPQAAVQLARQTAEKLDFQNHALTDSERIWASAKFARDWKKFKGMEFHWWVRERYIQTIGIVGDKTALPVLKDILTADTLQGKTRNNSDDRYVYLAINAVTRLINKDVRDKPVENMDIEKVRHKVLELIKNEK